jgi:DNA-binding IclR family transcriptional regulator
MELRRIDGVPVAALVVVGPTSRFGRDRFAELGEVVARLAATWPG